MQCSSLRYTTTHLISISILACCLLPQNLCQAFLVVVPSPVSILSTNNGCPCRCRTTSGTTGTRMQSSTDISPTIIDIENDAMKAEVQMQAEVEEKAETDIRTGTGTGSGTTLQTERDILMEQWYKTHGIICPNIELRTTPQSVGGRGLFFNSNSNRGAVQGDIVAFIPHELILNVSNLPSSVKNMSKDSKNKNIDEELLSSSCSWPTILTMYVYQLCLSNNEHDHDYGSGGGDGHDECDGIDSQIASWREWIEFWDGGGPTRPRPLESYTSDEIEALVKMAGDNNSNSASIETMSKVIDKRYQTFSRDIHSVKQFINIDNEDLFASLYSIVLSRTANLGPQWKNGRSIIPLHDMINHPPISSDDSTSTKSNTNIELFCIGDLRTIVDHGTFTRLLSSLQTSASMMTTATTTPDSTIEQYSDKDVILVASKDISMGDELLLSYRRVDHSENVDEKMKMWLLLQYGFSFW